MNGLMGELQGADAAPTSQVAHAVEEVQKAFVDLQKRAKDLLENDLPKVNEELQKAGQKALEVK